MHEDIAKEAESHQTEQLDLFTDYDAVQQQ